MVHWRKYELSKNRRVAGENRELASGSLRAIQLATGRLKTSFGEPEIRIPQVENVMRQDSQFTLQGRGDDFVTEVIQCLSENRIRVTDFRTVLPNLEDVFLKLTGHSIRD